MYCLYLYNPSFLVNFELKAGLFFRLLAQNSDNSKLRNHQNSAKFRQNSAKFSPKLRFSEIHEKFFIHYLNISLVKLIKLLSNHTLLSQLTILPKKIPSQIVFLQKSELLFKSSTIFNKNSKKNSSKLSKFCPKLRFSEYQKIEGAGKRSKNQACFMYHRPTVQGKKKKFLTFYQYLLNEI